VAPPRAGILGIDFGVTYSSATLAMGESVDALADDEGRWQIPSVVVFPGARARPLVGWAAREVQAKRPDLALASIKRLLGRHYSDPHVAGLLHTSSFFASEGPGDTILLRCAGEELAVPQLCALVLRHLVELAGPVPGDQPLRAVLTHPVSYGPQQQEALQRAAQLAGIEVAGLLEEPVAAALAYGAARDSNEIVAVYDFGGGTFDFTLLEMRGVEYQVLGSEGDPWLGGDDFDNALAEAIANGFWRKTQVELRERAVEWQRLLLACEQTKCDLSTAEAAAFELDELQVSGGAVSIKHVIERPAFERVCRKLVLQSVEICRAAMQQAKLTPRAVTRVLLAGGTSRIPLIRRGLERFFDREIAEVVDPEAAVALGAGIHAAWLAGD
jgi:molecular chaperone DnaK